ncbi:MAG: DUF2752 domain-containing protein [Ignavibacteriaceae bacterium]
MEDLVLNKISSSAQRKFQLYFILKNYFKIVGLEATIWIIGLLYLAFFSPIDQTHFTICPLKNAGIDFCPGCGLGHSITQIFHGNFIQSLNTHPLGFFAISVITHRIYFLIKKNIINIKKAKA